MPEKVARDYRELLNELLEKDILKELVKKNKKIKEFLEGTEGISASLFNTPKNVEISDETKISLINIFLQSISREERPENLGQNEINSIYIASIFNLISIATPAPETMPGTAKPDLASESASARTVTARTPSTTSGITDDKTVAELNTLLNNLYCEQEITKNKLIKTETKENKEVHFFNKTSTLGVLAKSTEVTFNTDKLTAAAPDDQKAFYYALFDAASIKEFEPGVVDGSLKLKSAILSPTSLPNNPDLKALTIKHLALYQEDNPQITIDLNSLPASADKTSLLALLEEAKLTAANKLIFSSEKIPAVAAVPNPTRDDEPPQINNEDLAEDEAQPAEKPLPEGEPQLEQEVKTEIEIILGKITYLLNWASPSSKEKSFEQFDESLIEQEISEVNKRLSEFLLKKNEPGEVEHSKENLTQIRDSLLTILKPKKPEEPKESKTSEEPPKLPEIKEIKEINFKEVNTFLSASLEDLGQSLIKKRESDIKAEIKKLASETHEYYKNLHSFIQKSSLKQDKGFSSLVDTLLRKREKQLLDITGNSNIEWLAANPKIA